MKRFTLPSLFLALTLGCAGAPPPNVSSVFRRMELMLEEPVVHFQLELGIIPERVAIDPPPSSKDFEKHAAVLVTLNAGYNRDQIKTMLQALMISQWSPIREPKIYSKTRVRIISSSEVLLEMGLGSSGAAIRVDGIWYETGTTAIDSLLRLFESTLVAELRARDRTKAAPK